MTNSEKPSENGESSMDIDTPQSQTVDWKEGEFNVGDKVFAKLKGRNRRLIQSK